MFQVVIMTVELADYLLGLEKYIVEDDQQVQSITFDLNSPVKIKFQMISPSDPDQLFMLDIQESAKSGLKISFHHQDDLTHHGLLRIDYHSRHRNPTGIKDTVPETFKPYAGIYLDEYPGHIHYIVDGYAPLEWAIPLEVDDFPIKDVKSIQDVDLALMAFFNKINLRTKINLLSSQLRII